jgi:hypothetical protein
MKPDETFVEHDRKFHNVPFGAVDRDWKTVGMKFWKKRETLPVYEARSSLYAVKHILRKRDNFGKRHLILSDSLTATCAISQGRAQGFTLRRVCSQIGALVLSSGISICIRWIPSEWNPSDNPSRGHWSPSIPKRFFGDGSLQGEHPSGAAAMDWEANGKEDTAEIEGKFIKGIPDLSSCAEYPTRGVVDCKHENKCQKPKDLASSESEECDHPDSQTDDLSGSCIGVKAVTLSLYKLLGMDETGVAEQKAEAEASAYGRQAAEREAGSAFPRWGGHQHGSIPGGCHSVFQPQFEVAEHERLTKSAAVPQGLEEGCASTEPSSCPLGSDVPLGRDGAFKPTLQHCNPSPAYVHFISSTLGGFADSCMRCDSAFKGPGGCLQAMGFVLHPEEVGIPSKTQDFDETLQLDLEYHKGIGEAINRYMIKNRIHGNQVILSHTNSDVNQFLEEQLTALNLQKLGHMHAYRFRHGGASHDYVNKFRQLASVQQRGRWKSMNSTRRYQKGGRLAQIFQALPSDVQQRCVAATDAIQATLQRGL